MQHRNALYLGVCSGNRELVEYLLSLAENGAVEEQGRSAFNWTCNQTESVWGWSVLHAAANRGDMAMVLMLLNAGASIYMKSKVRTMAVIMTIESSKCAHKYLVLTMRLVPDTEDGRRSGQGIGAHGGITIHVQRIDN